MRPHSASIAPGALCALLVACAAFPARALYLREPITAYRVADNALVIDGKPDSLWRSLFAMPNGNRPLSFQDYAKMVVLQPDKARNDDPAKYVANPGAGSATLMAAYDSQALYFFFLVKAAAFANPKALSGCQAADAWKVDAAELYLDPSAWSEDTLDYRSYFTADASGLVYGTSPRSIQVDKAVRDTGVYYRDRKTGDRFQAAVRPSGLTVAVAPRTASDSGWVGVEMRIPFWTSSADFEPGRSLFLSWGFNRYGDSARTSCAGNPLAYRWAKHYLNYDQALEKPPGWRSGDSTHYDPSRSWDGWGELTLDAERVVNQCKSPDSKSVFDANWNADYWVAYCHQGGVVGNRRGFVRMDAAGMPVPSRSPPRDARGRAVGPEPSVRSASPGFFPSP